MTDLNDGGGAPPRPGPRLSATRRARDVGPGWLLAALIVVSALARYLAQLRLNGLWIMPDEVIYASLGESLYDHGRLAVLDGPQVLYSVVYPAFVGLPLTLGAEHGHAILKAVQPVVMSLAAVPVYLWGRTLMPARWALLAAALTLAVPGLLYSGLLMTHVAYYPVGALAAWAIARALERETPRDQLLACAAILLALATRLQAVVLLPALVTAILLKAAFDRKPARVARFAPTALVLGALGAGWIGWRVVHGGHWSSGLGPYAAAGKQSYDAGDVARFVSYHLGDVVLMTGVLPVCAVLLLAVEAARGRESSAAVRAYLALTLALAAWEIVEVGAFASENAGLVLERDILSLAPLAFLGFALWLARGAPRTWLQASLVAIVALAPLVTMPLSTLVGPDALPDSFSLAPLADLQRRSPATDLVLVVSLCAGAAAVLFVLVPRRFVAILPAVVLVWLVGASVSSTREVTKRVRDEQTRLLGAPERDWIDDSVHSHAAFVYDGEPYWNGVWQEVYWNRKLRRVYDLHGSRVPGPLPQTAVAARADGRLLDHRGRPLRAQYVVASSEHTFFGTPLRTLAQTGVESKGLTLWRAASPTRLSTVTQGVKDNGDLVGPARITVYDCRGGRLRLTLLPKATHEVELYRDGKLVRTLQFHGEESWSGTVPALPSPKPRVCTFDIAPSSLLGSTVLTFDR